MLSALLPAAGVVAAPAKFTLVIGGKITSEPALQERGGILVSARAVSDLARAAGDVGLSADAEAAVVSITHGRGEIADAWRGWKGSAITFVIDGKITRVPAHASEGVPYLAPKDLKRIAESLGFSADLDAGAGVLALGRKSGERPVGGGEADSGASAPHEDARPSYGMNGTFMQSIAGAAGSAGHAHPVTAGGGSGGDVCGYLDRMKDLWCETEPSAEEKSTMDRLARLFQENEKKVKKGQKVQGNPADLKALEDTLKSFDAKVRRRLEGTKDSHPPAGAQEWYDTSMEFLDDTEAVMKLSLELVNIYKQPPAKQKSKEEIQKMHKRLKSLNQQVQGLGAKENELILEVRTANGCGGPECE